MVSTRTSCSSMLRMRASDDSTASSPVKALLSEQLVRSSRPLTRNLGMTDIDDCAC